MIVLSVGMPRAGSGWHYNIIHDLMDAAGYDDAREIREKFRLQNILTEVNVNIGVLSLRRLGMVSIPALMGRDFVLKAHAGPTTWSRTLATLGLLRIVYIYRDPRDAMLSAYEYGQRSIEKGRPNFFSRLKNFDETLSFMADYVKIWEDWMREKNILITSYEALLTDYDTEINHLLSYLGVDVSEEKYQKVIEEYRPGKADTGQQGLHFFKGKIGRYKEAYTNDQQAQIQERFGTSLKKMGYEV
ncbi:MAG: hypothetical protein HN736_11900 [Anaerolineae bacterium]|jgi:hypothetical protein|nr:hypothetical protein [Anaerolineae bacterium]MBT3711984.1 hypothetical protein [Anaerolineae bacterium]MBT4310441.1 hypothetical protein [Anaerolineae bacterium]MBT4458777.1 hypothetical protein [Anaerolineae bacterium]MBT4842213.1 hypothetical protein [Anaerolineae bacterium]